MYFVIPSTPGLHARPSRTGLLLLAFMALALPESRTHAQTARDTAGLAPVVVTASRTGAVQGTATTATTVLQGEALRARGITTVAAALRELPGATVVQSGARGSQTSLFLRGGEADYVQVMIDGVTINEPGGAFNFANLTLDDVDRIEIVRGPVSVLYGANAMTGVIQIFTRGSGQPKAELSARAGQRGLVDADVSVSRPIAANGSWWVGAGHHRSSGIYDLNNDLRSSTVSGRVQLAPTAATALAVTARYADARFDYPTEYYGAPLDSNSSNTERRLAIGTNLSYALRPNADIRVVLGMSRFQNIASDPLDDRTGPPDDGSPLPFETRSLRQNADAQLDLRVIPGATLTLGAEFDWQELESATSDPATDSLLGRWSRGAYAQLIGDLGGRVSYSIGARTEDNERFGRLGSLRAGAGIRIGPATLLRASSGTAFKEPQFIEITGGGFALPNPALEPERSTSWEVAVEQRFAGDRIAVAATYFDQAFRNMILYTLSPVSTGYSARYINAQAADATGWELEARAATDAGLTVRASLSLLAGDIRATDDAPAAPLPRRASRTASLAATVPIGSRLRVTADRAWIGSRPDVRFFPGEPFQQDELLPSYDLMGLAVTYSMRAPTSLAIDLITRVDNLLDERYEAVAGFATERRAASVGVRIAFRP